MRIYRKLPTYHSSYFDTPSVRGAGHNVEANNTYSLPLSSVNSNGWASIFIKYCYVSHVFFHTSRTAAESLAKRGQEGLSETENSGKGIMVIVESEVNGASDANMV